MAAPGEATAAEMPGASTNTGGSGGYEPDTTASRENVVLFIQPGPWFTTATVYSAENLENELAETLENEELLKR
jgi:hypothetical protein